MIIGFDLQALQTEQSRNRGIGRFTENIVNKLLELDTKDNFILFLNGNYKEKANVKTTTNSKVTIIDYVEPQHFSKNSANHLIQFFNYLNSKLDVLQIFSAFEGYPSNLPVVSPYLNKTNSVLCTVIHDLIPLHYPEQYLSSPELKTSYYKKLKTIYDSDMLFAVSESTRADAVNILGYNPKKIFYIGEAASESFYKTNISSSEIEKIKKKYGIKKRFILYTSGVDFRKNIEKSIIAFSKIDKSLLGSLSYVIVCTIHDIDKKRFQDLAKSSGLEDNVVFTGHVSDNELNNLYNCCDLFFYPSLIEGFGLPILEAMTCGAPIIGSNNSSMAELIEDSDFMFDPTNEDEMALSITKMILNPELKQKSIIHSLEKSKEFSWNDCAKKILDTYNSIDLASLKKSQTVTKPRIAFFCPLPPKKSGIANYCASLLPFLAKYWDMDIFIDDYICADPYLTANFSIYSYTEFERLNQLDKYDSIVYQVGNSDNHSYMFDFIKKYPGVVVLHDVFLSGVLYWITAKVGKLNEFIDEVIYSHGEKGREMVEKAQKNLISWDQIIWNFQVNKRFLDSATEIIVHSKWDKSNIVELYPQFEDKISLVDQFAPLKINDQKLAYKTSLGFSKNDFLICSFGFVVSTKKIDSIVKNLRTFLQKNPNCKYVIVGESTDPYGQYVKNLVNEFGLGQKILFTDFIDDITYNKYLTACDVCISLRTNARAGTSASVNHSLGAGLPTIISDEGPFSEFPDDIVIKIKPNEEKNLDSLLADLYTNPQKLQSLGKSARKYAEEKLSKDVCVEKYVLAVNKALQKKESK